MFNRETDEFVIIPAGITGHIVDNHNDYIGEGTILGNIEIGTQFFRNKDNETVVCPIPLYKVDIDGVITHTEIIAIYETREDAIWCTKQQIVENLEEC